MNYLNCKLFKDLNKYEINRLINLLEINEKTYNKSSYIFQVNDIPKHIYILLSGSVKIEKVDLNGRTTIVNIFRETGTIFGEVYLFINNYNYDYSCITLEDTKLLLINKSLFYKNNSELEIQKKLTRNMIEVLAEKAFYLNQKNIILGSFSIRQKLINFFLQKNKNSNKIYLEFNREELADYVGVTRPSISRELMKMEREGLIKVEKNIITIIDIDNLKINS